MHNTRARARIVSRVSRRVARTLISRRNGKSSTSADSHGIEVDLEAARRSGASRFLRMPPSAALDGDDAASVNANSSAAAATRSTEDRKEV
jgi:hypothetical protein